MPNRDVVMHVRDVTEKQKMILKLQSNEQRFRQIVENFAVPVTIVDLETKEILFKNTKTSDLLRSSSGSFPKIGEKITNYYADPKIREALEEELGLHRVFGPKEIEYLRKDGTFIWTIITSVLIDFEGHKANLNTIVDIT